MVNRTWNPYIKSVPTSKKLKLRCFEDMANKNKNPGTLKPGTTGNEILYIIKQYGNYPEEKVKELIIDKKPDTIRKAIKRLENSGYVIRRKGINGEIIIGLTRFARELLSVDETRIATTPKKLSRIASLAITSMVFEKSCPTINSTNTVQHEFYESKETILKANPGCEKILNISRMVGVYHHYDEIIPVFKLGTSMYWVDNAERSVKEYMEQRIYNVPITKAIFLIENYEIEAMRFIKVPEGARNSGSSLRESLEFSSCYQKVFLFSTNWIGIKQLKLFRSFQNIEELFLEAVFEINQRNRSDDTVVDGYIDNINCIVLFSGDIIKIKKISRILDAGMLDHVNIICYDFQEDFLRTVFEEWNARVVYNSYSIEELKEVFNY